MRCCIIAQPRDPPAACSHACARKHVPGPHLYFDPLGDGEKPVPRSGTHFSPAFPYQRKRLEGTPPPPRKRFVLHQRLAHLLFMKSCFLGPFPPFWSRSAAAAPSKQRAEAWLASGHPDVANLIPPDVIPLKGPEALPPPMCRKKQKETPAETPGLQSSP